MAIPKSNEGVVEMIWILKAAQDTAVKAQTQVMVALKAMIIVTADAELRAQLEPLFVHFPVSQSLRTT